MKDDDDSSVQKMGVQLSIRAELIDRLSIEGFGLEERTRREVSVMTRMSQDIVDILDALVDLEVFKSRSEAVAAFVVKVIQARKPLYMEIKKQAEEVRKKRSAAQRLAIQVMKESNSEDEKE